MANREPGEIDASIKIMMDLEVFRPSSWQMLADRAKLLSTQFANTMLREGGPWRTSFEISRSIFYGAQSAVVMNSKAISKDFTTDESRRCRISEARAAGELITGVLHAAVEMETSKLLADSATPEQIGQIRARNRALAIQGTQQRLGIFRTRETKILNDATFDINPFRPTRKATLALAKMDNGTVTQESTELINAVFNTVFEPR